MRIPLYNDINHENMVFVWGKHTYNIGREAETCSHTNIYIYFPHKLMNISFCSIHVLLYNHRTNINTHTQTNNPAQQSSSSPPDMNGWTAMLPSFEFMNFVFALIVWSSRYPSVYWNTSKAFAIIFSIQMIVNAIDLLLVFAGVSVIYKLQIVGQKLPLQVSFPFSCFSAFDFLSF